MENQITSSRAGSRAGDESPEQGPFSPPAISLPKGGGAIRGIGEKFAAKPVTGTGSLSVPIATSPGRSGFVRLRQTLQSADVRVDQHLAIGDDWMRLSFRLLRVVVTLLCCLLALMGILDLPAGLNA